ncbi:MAG TPA: type VI secretion system baseplate subunit TssE [Myxococcaceae bacterium]|jgi:type VI secretion system protein|nr:type VI secretion system baseplate subunit TssE [Myxococcaceae bacterium]HZA51863.1 type VI secretion system baseplate subunit TssE [Myxococcaceae bacterium]
MSRRGLLARMEEGDPRTDAGDLNESIVEHLRVLLNTRRGSCATQPEFGVVDFTDLVHGFPASVQALQQAIRATILTFEPRLRGVTVRYLPQEDPLALRFEITAQSAHRGARGVLRFSTQMHPGGKMEVW